jgi:acetolactate synthase-1/3 small subunit
MIDVENLRNSEDIEARNILSILVENKPGVLSRISGLVSRRSYNISSLTVSTTHDPKISRVSVVVNGDKSLVKQISGQLAKLINVINIEILNEKNSIEQEIIFAKVNASGVDEQQVPIRKQIIELASVFGAKIVDSTDETIIIEAAGEEAKLDNLITELKRFGLIELVRSGAIVISKGSETLWNTEAE